MLMQMHGKKGLNGDGRLLRWFLVPLLPKPLYAVSSSQVHLRDLWPEMAQFLAHGLERLLARQPPIL